VLLLSPGGGVLLVAGGGGGGGTPRMSVMDTSDAVRLTLPPGPPAYCPPPAWEIVFDSREHEPYYNRSFFTILMQTLLVHYVKKVDNPLEG
jgi:hypothetical protein